MKAVNLLHLEIWHVQGEGMGEPGSEPGQDSVWQHTPKVCQLHGCLWVGGGSIAHICQPTIWNPNIITTLGCTIRLQSNLRRLRWCSERPFRLMTQLLDWRVSRWFSNTKLYTFLCTSSYSPGCWVSQYSRWVYEEMEEYSKAEQISLRSVRIKKELLLWFRVGLQRFDAHLQAHWGPWKVPGVSRRKEKRKDLIGERIFQHISTASLGMDRDLSKVFPRWWETLMRNCSSCVLT